MVHLSTAWEKNSPNNWKLLLKLSYAVLSPSINQINCQISPNNSTMEYSFLVEHTDETYQ